MYNIALTTNTNGKHQLLLNNKACKIVLTMFTCLILTGELFKDFSKIIINLSVWFKPKVPNLFHKFGRVAQNVRDEKTYTNFFLKISKRLYRLIVLFKLTLLL